MKLTITAVWLAALMSVLTCFAHPNPAEAYTIKRGTTGKAIHWENDLVTFQFSPGFEAMLPGEGARRSFDIASDAWRGLPSVPDVSLVSGDPGELGYHNGTSNGIYLVPDAGYADHKLAITIATFEDESGRTIDTDIVINASQPFELLKERGNHHTEEPSFDLASTLTHEVGHVLGLGESNDDPTATMWPNMGADATTPRTLELDDEHGVILLYREAAASTGKGCARASMAETNRSSWIGFVFAFTALALFYRRKLVRVAVGGWVFLFLVGASPNVGPEPAPRTTNNRGHVTIPNLFQHALFHAKRSGTSRTPSLAHYGVPIPSNFQSARIGRAALHSVNLRKGLIWSSYRVPLSDHEVMTLEIVGGTTQGLRQKVGGLPELRNGQEVVVHNGEHGLSWAFKAKDHWYGAPIRSLRK